MEKAKERICKVCDRPIPDSHTDNLCDGCWEVTSRLEDFIAMPNGRKIVEKALRREAT